MRSWLRQSRFRTMRATQATLVAALSCFGAMPSAIADESSPATLTVVTVATARPAAAAGPELAGDASGRAWSERRTLFGSMRWWADPAHLDRLRALGPGGMQVQVEWAVPAGDEDGITADERTALCDDKAWAMGAGGRVGAEPAQYSARVRVTEAWRPYRLLNVLIIALPGPSAPFMTQGGAATEVELLDADGRPVAGFACRGYAGVARFAHAFGRIGHTRGVLQDCALAFAETMRAGQLPEPPRAAVAEHPLTK